MQRPRLGPSLNPGLVAEQCNKAGIPWAIYHFRWPRLKRSLTRGGWEGFCGFWCPRVGNTGISY